MKKLHIGEIFLNNLKVENQVIYGETIEKYLNNNFTYKKKN